MPAPVSPAPVSFETGDQPLTPGVTLQREGTRFVVHSRHATAMDLCLYDPDDDSRETARIRMRRTECDLWYATVRDVKAGTLYGYRALGPWLPKNAMRFNAKKLMLDPYARAIHGRPDEAEHMRTVPDPQHAPGCVDNGAKALKSVVIDEMFDWAGDAAPRVPWRDTVICELHVKGFTKTHPDLPAKIRGTYAGLAHPSVTSYLKDLGITAVQLLPVHQHLDDGFLLGRKLTNYWGYNTIGFFAPHNTYAAAKDPQEQVREFKTMVKALHAAGIEVILDVVYNHTAEGNEYGPSLMFRGLDDHGYYRHHYGEDGAGYLNVTGCGNSVDSASTPALRLILDSLRYWVTEMHVDGFRFDLAVTVARNEKDGFNPQSQFLSAVAQDPVLSKVKLIAEAWDISREDSYQVGHFPEPWRELNGKYRDTVRSWWRGDPGATAEFAKRLCGSQDIYGWNQRPPIASINFLTSHDGFTLMDLVSYSHKHNEANREDNRDGDNHNHSTNCGVEGQTKDAKVIQARARLRRGMIATMMCSLGVPFLTAGDERGRTQGGNNNAYCQDNEISWLDWNHCDKDMLDFTRRMTTFRRRLGTFRRSTYFDGKLNPTIGLRDVTWLEGNGTLLCHEEWHSEERRCFGALLGPQNDSSTPLLLLFNNGSASEPFILPGDKDIVWTLAFDTSLSPSFPNGQVTHAGGRKYALQGQSVVCLELTTTGAGLDLEPKAC
ncbi:glycogen debranching protein GlgX [Prosthecobacter sp.]|uniref:glycogen debranching protein GlgX n=1 Tax=Prosthecobacter sp. TaxID=1965333 RepID=UPI001D479951|nr:glycogen debranching protein GlgX [Prosthecobacter sp.]MCB1277438.1 glycogen debranching protein GlgX [Prosthecobacter sp.]